MQLYMYNKLKQIKINVIDKLIFTEQTIIINKTWCIVEWKQWMNGAYQR